MADKSVPERITGWLTLLDLLGVKGVLLSASGSFAIAAWSWAKGLPGPEIAVLALVAAAAILILAIAIERFWRPKTTVAVSVPAGATPFKEIRTRTFRNETILLDACDFIDCVFHDCTLQYEGGPYRLTATRIEGVTAFVSTLPAVSNAFSSCRALGLLPNTNVIQIRKPANL